MIPDDRQQSNDENDEEVEEIIRDDTVRNDRPQPNQSPDINQDRNILYQISQDEVIILEFLMRRNKEIPLLAIIVPKYIK